jgi:hypothetical protein
MRSAGTGGFPTSRASHAGWPGGNGRAARKEPTLAALLFSAQSHWSETFKAWRAAIASRLVVPDVNVRRGGPMKFKCAIIIGP